MTSTWHWLVVLMPLFLLIDTASADRPARKIPYVDVADDKQYLFIMVPENYQDNDTTPARGTAYQLQSDGSLLELWRVEGWYGKIHLAQGGQHLVREGPWASKPPEEELAVAFYTDGQEIARYTVSDLLEDLDSVERSVSHYLWEGRQQGYPRLTIRGQYQLTTIEGIFFTFDLETGEIVSERRIGSAE